MLRWLISLLLLFVFVLPNPVQAGNTVGNAAGSLIVFLRNVADEVDIDNEIENTAPPPGASAYGADSVGDDRDRVDPPGGVAWSDGTTADSDDDALLLGLQPPR